MRLNATLALATALAFSAPASAAEPQPLTQIAFGSCADQREPQLIWDAVLAYRPELFLFAGDNVYGDVPNAPDLKALQAAYAQTKVIDGLQQLRREVPHLATWDDHDYGRNDGGADFPMKAEAQALFLDFWQAPADDPRRTREGVYTARTFGPAGQRVQVILLDTRSFRSTLRPTDQRNAPGKERYLPDDDPSKTVLGEAQWAWLAEELRKPAELRLILSSIQALAEGHGWERWGNLPRERQRLLDTIRDTAAAGVVLLSGDRHIAGLYEAAEGAPYPLVEITSSGINKFWPAPSDLQGNRIGGAYGRENFGTVDIDWWEREVRLAVRGMNGEVVRERRVRMDALKPATS